MNGTNPHHQIAKAPEEHEDIEAPTMKSKPTTPIRQTSAPPSTSKDDEVKVSEEELEPHHKYRHDEHEPQSAKVSREEEDPD